MVVKFFNKCLVCGDIIWNKKLAYRIQYSVTDDIQLQEAFLCEKHGKELDRHVDFLEIEAQDDDTI